MGDSAAGKWDRGYSRLGVRLGEIPRMSGWWGNSAEGNGKSVAPRCGFHGRSENVRGSLGQDDSADFRTIINRVWGGEMDFVRPKSGDGG